MSQLVTTLKNEHVVILDLLTEVQKLGIASPQGKEKLYKAKTLILSHLQKEDAQLYPKLMNSPATANIAKSFSSEMSNLAKSVLEFFAKYENSGTDMEFAKDVGRIVGVLKLRITKEENQLYPAFDKIDAA